MAQAKGYVVFVVVWTLLRAYVTMFNQKKRKGETKVVPEGVCVRRGFPIICSLDPAPILSSFQDRSESVWDSFLTQFGKGQSAFLVSARYMTPILAGIYA